MIARVMLLRYPQNVAALGPILWEMLGHWITGGRSTVVPQSTGRCEALLEFNALRSEVLP